MRYNRRKLLSGLGSIIAIPYFESLGFSDTYQAHKNLVIVFSPNGMNMDCWNLKQDAGPIKDLSPTLLAFKEHQSDIVVCNGLAQTKARANGDGGGDHARSMSTFLTGVQIKKTDGSNISAGISADQIAANFFKQYYRIPSLQIGIESGKTAGNCDSGYSCAYSSTISWANPQLPLPVDNHPQNIFNRIYGSKLNSQTIEQYRSIIDFSLSQVNKLKKDMNGSDKRKLEEYLNSVREIERKIELEKQVPKISENIKDLFNDKPDLFSNHSKILIDLIVLALQTNCTKIVTLTLGNEGSNRSYKEIQVDEGHHELSHHQNNIEKLDKIARINKLHSEQVAYLFTKLKQAKIFDNTIVSYGCGIEDGNSHKHHDLPILVAGGGIKGNQYKVFDQETPLNNLWLGLLNHIGIPMNNTVLGDSNFMIDLNQA